VSCDLLTTSSFVGSFDELALLEDGAGADEGDQVRCVTGIPSWSKAVRDGERRVVGATFVDPTHWYCADGAVPDASARPTRC
jgi:hypothetical protein